MAQCKICGERMGWASGKAYGGPASDIGLALGALLGIREKVDSADPNAQALDNFISSGGKLAHALHLAAHSRGMVPNRQAWDAWQETSIGVLNDFKSAYPGIMNDGERMQRGGRRARALVLGEPYASSVRGADSNVHRDDSSSSVEIARKLVRLKREHPVAWDFGEALARMALDGRSSYLIERIHENGEEGARFYAEEISSAVPEALREAVAGDEIDVPTPISADAEEAARLAAYTSLMEWLTAEPRSA